jgi:hypothetical protein
MFVTYCNKNRREKIFVVADSLNALLDGIKYSRAKNIQITIIRRHSKYILANNTDRMRFFQPPRVIKGIST